MFLAMFTGVSILTVMVNVNRDFVQSGQNYKNSFQEVNLTLEMQGRKISQNLTALKIQGHKDMQSCQALQIQCPKWLIRSQYC